MPYLYFEIMPEGDVYTCCPAWLPKPIGNILKQDKDQIWNSKSAQQIRKSVTEGSFEFCDKSVCPSLITKTGQVRHISTLSTPCSSSSFKFLKHYPIKNPNVKKHILDSKFKLNYGPITISVHLIDHATYHVRLAEPNQSLQREKIRRKLSQS